jgi:hypothetical protein
VQLGASWKQGIVDPRLKTFFVASKYKFKE